MTKSNKWYLSTIITFKSLIIVGCSHVSVQTLLTQIHL